MALGNQLLYCGQKKLSGRVIYFSCVYFFCQSGVETESNVSHTHINSYLYVGQCCLWLIDLTHSIDSVCWLKRIYCSVVYGVFLQASTRSVLYQNR
jgi:hypothetical protein